MTVVHKILAFVSIFVGIPLNIIMLCQNSIPIWLGVILIIMQVPLIIQVIFSKKFNQ